MPALKLLQQIKPNAQIFQNASNSVFCYTKLK